MEIKRTTKLDSKRRNRKRSATKLNEHFDAPNIQTERLTLKSSKGPGLFNKGKASAGIDCKDLPDLTFSEMKFLSRKMDQKHTQDTRNEKRSSSRRTKPYAVEDISAFFSNHANNGPKSQLRHTSKQPKTTMDIEREGEEMSHIEPTGSHCSWQQSQRKSPRPLEPDCPRSWLISPSRRPSGSMRTTAPHMLDGNVSRLSPILTPVKSTTVHPMSSASNQRAREYANHALFGDIQTFVQPKKSYVTLEDLKLLWKQREADQLSTGLANTNQTSGDAQSRNDIGPQTTAKLTQTDYSAVTGRLDSACTKRDDVQEWNRYTDVTCAQEIQPMQVKSSHPSPDINALLSYAPSGSIRASYRDGQPAQSPSAISDWPIGKHPYGIRPVWHDVYPPYADPTQMQGESISLEGFHDHTQKNILDIRTIRGGQTPEDGLDPFDRRLLCTDDAREKPQMVTEHHLPRDNGSDLFNMDKIDESRVSFDNTMQNTFRYADEMDNHSNDQRAHKFPTRQHWDYRRGRSVFTNTSDALIQSFNRPFTGFNRRPVL